MVWNGVVEKFQHVTLVIWRNIRSFEAVQFSNEQQNRLKGVSYIWLWYMKYSEKCRNIGYNRPTLCTDYYSFIYYLGCYMFWHLCAIFSEHLFPCELLESLNGLCHRDVPLYCKCWCAPDVVVSCITSHFTGLFVLTATCTAYPLLF
jgi:hypothetical protein